MLPSPETIGKVLAQYEARKDWSNNTNLRELEGLIIEEALELSQASAECEVGQSAFALASEIGDVLIYYIQYNQTARHQKQRIPDHVCGAMEYALDVCNRTGIDPNDAITMKLVRNSVKYGDYISNLGSPLDANLSKQLYKAMGGDARFSRWYEDFGDQF
jgi:NTP pyrophosphatase (non-canonical NTP hydrolase)